MATVTTERNVLIEFIELYKDLRCLWDSSCKLYSNKDARNQALQLLLGRLKIIESYATIGSVKKKIENMIAGYKREAKKVQQSKSTGVGAGEVYVPTLWYYEYFKFLDEKETLNRTGVDTISTCDDDEVSETQSTICRPPACKRRVTLMKKQEKLIDSAQNLLSVEDNPAESYGRAIGLQLREMIKVQRCIAEKFISEVIFYGKLDQLSIKSSITLIYAHNYPVPSSTPASATYDNYNSPGISESPSPVHSPSYSPMPNLINRHTSNEAFQDSYQQSSSIHQQSSTLIPNITTMHTPNDQHSLQQPTNNAQSSSYNMQPNTIYDCNRSIISDFLIMRT